MSRKKLIRHALPQRPLAAREYPTRAQKLMTPCTGPGRNPNHAPPLVFPGREASNPKLSIIELREQRVISAQWGECESASWLASIGDRGRRPAELNFPIV